MDDYISREQLLNRIAAQKCDGRTGTCKDCDTKSFCVYGVVEAFPAADVEPERKWISATERLPKQSDKWETYIVNVIRSHYPTSPYDSCDAPYTEDIVVSAMYDSKQKIWHLEWDEQLNALIDIDDSPLDGDFVSHWMPLPEPPSEEV